MRHQVERCQGAWKQHSNARLSSSSLPGEAGGAEHQDAGALAELWGHGLSEPRSGAWLWTGGAAPAHASRLGTPQTISRPRPVPQAGKDHLALCSPRPLNAWKGLIQGQDP